MGPVRLLLVDDDETVLAGLSLILEANEFEVTTAGNVVEALRLIAAERFDVLLTDLHMPEVSGYDLCASVRRNPRLAHLPIIIMSALDGAEYRESIQPFNVARYLTKPLAMDEVFAAIAAALAS